MRRFMWIAAAALPALALADPAPVEELELSSLLDLETHAATKRATLLSETPAVGNVLLREHIEDYGWLSLNDILYGQPGFFPSRDYERRTVGMRGEGESWNNNRILLLVDGMPQNDVEAGTAYTWEVTPLFMARSVEVLRGPGSALYGSYAENGVIAMETLSPADLGGDRVLGRLLVGPGGETADALATIGGRFGDVLFAYNRVRSLGDQERGVDNSGRVDENGDMRRFDIDDRHTSSTVFFKALGKGAFDGISWSIQQQSWDFATGRGWLDAVPDHENMREWRLLASLRYRTPNPTTWSHEYSVQLQRHGYREDLNLTPRGTDEAYPDGVSEIIDTQLTSLFARAQIARTLPRDGQLLAGVEYTGLLYGGDELHLANADLGDPDAPAWDSMQEVGPMYEPIVDHLVSKLGVFAQLSTGGLLGERLELTAGLRYDNLFFDYDDIQAEGKPTRSRSFQDLSPRVALIWRAADPLVLKAMAARAFRTPTPVELFIANTWTAAGTDIDSFRAERQDTYELAADWHVVAPLKLRANGWVSRLDGSIGYDVTEAAIVNRYDLWRAGFESELALDARLGRGTQLDGWLSWSLAHQLSETVHDPLLGQSDRLTRAPEHLAKLGARLRRGRLAVSVQGLYHGEVHRRPSDLETEENRAMRPDVIPGWVSFDATLHVRVAEWLRAGIIAKDVLDSAGKLAVTRDAPFDYLAGGRRVSLELALEL